MEKRERISDCILLMPEYRVSEEANECGLSFE